MKYLITNEYGGSSSGGSFSTIHRDSANQYFHKETKETVDPFRPAYIRHLHCKINDKNFTYSQQDAINLQVVEKLMKVVGGLLHAEEVEKKRLETFLQGKLVKDKKSIFEPFYKARLITGNKNKKKKKKQFLKPLSVVKRGLPSSWLTY